MRPHGRAAGGFELAPPRRILWAELEAGDLRSPSVTWRRKTSLAGRVLFCSRAQSGALATQSCPKGRTTRRSSAGRQVAARRSPVERDAPPETGCSQETCCEWAASLRATHCLWALHVLRVSNSAPTPQLCNWLPLLISPKSCHTARTIRQN